MPSSITNRKQIPKAIQARVLYTSRRRCCLCFAYEKRDEECKGQIAHIDRNRNNNSFENLAFLCLSHHDAYDGTPSQSKRWQPEEVRLAREMLYEGAEKSRTVTINITKDLESLTPRDIQRINSVIAILVGRDVEINFMSGSTKLEMTLSRAETLELMRAMREGALSEYGNHTISVRHSGEANPPPILDDNYDQQIVTAAVPRDLTLETLISPDRWQEWNHYELFTKRVFGKESSVLVIVGGNAESLRLRQVMLSLFLFDDEVGSHTDDAPNELLNRFAQRYGVSSVFHGLQRSKPGLIHTNIITPFDRPVPPNLAWEFIHTSIRPAFPTDSLKYSLFFFDPSRHPVIIGWMCILDAGRYADSLKEHGIWFDRRLLRPH